MTFLELETALYNWASGNVSVPVIWANENGNRPNSKYITLNLMSFVGIGRDDYTPPNEVGIREILSNEDFVLELTGFYQGSDEDLKELQNSLRFQAIIDNLSTSGVVVRNLNNPINNISSLVDETIEKRYIWEVNLGTCHTLTEDISFIDEVEVTNES